MTTATDILSAISNYTRDAKVRILTVLSAEQRMQEYYEDRNEKKYFQAKEEFIQICNSTSQAIIAASRDIATLNYDGDYTKLLMEI